MSDPVNIVSTNLEELKKEANNLFFALVFLNLAIGASTLILPLLLWRNENISASQIGIIQIISIITAMFTAGFFGNLSDKYNRKILIVFGTFTIGISFLPYIFSTNYGILLLAGFIRGLGGSMVSGPSTAYVADISPKNIRGEMMGKLSLANMSGSAIGFIIGGFLWDHLLKTSLYIFSAIALISGLYLIFHLKSSYNLYLVKDSKVREINPIREVYRSLKNKQFRHLSGIWISFACISGMIITYAPIILDSLAGNTSANETQENTGTTVGILFLIVGLIMGSTQILWGILSDKFGRKPFLLLGSSSLAILVSVLSFVFIQKTETISNYLKNPISLKQTIELPAPFAELELSFLYISLFLVTMIICTASFLPVSSALLADVTSSANRGTAMGLYKSILGVGNLIGILLGGLAIDILKRERAHLGIIIMCFLLAIINLSTVIFYLSEPRKIEEIFCVDDS